MEIKASKRLIAYFLVKDIFIAILISLFFYLVILAPYQSSVDSGDYLILLGVTIAFPVAYLLTTLPRLIRTILEVKNQKIYIGDSILNIITGAISIDTQSIPLSQVKYVNTNSSLLETFFGITTISIGSDESTIDLAGFPKQEAIKFAELAASRHKVKVEI